MQSNAPLLFLILLKISTPIQCQFEFNNLQAVYDVVVDAIDLVEVSCVTFLRPTAQNPQQKSAIDGLTYRLAKKFNSKLVTRRPSVMSYTLPHYEKFYINPSMRKKDTCIFWITVVMVSDSTTEQLAKLSAGNFFDNPYWILFANRSEHVSLFQNVEIRLTTKIFVVQDKGNGVFNASSVGRLGTDVGYVLWTKKDGLVPGSEYYYSTIGGLTLSVGTLEFPPYLGVIRKQDGQITSVTGFYGDLWNDLQATLKFNSVYIEPKDGIFGSYNENGTWTGLYSLIVEKQADVLLNEMTVSPERSKAVDFLHPIERTKYKVLYQKDAEIFDWLKVFRPLDYPVWIALIIWIIVGGTADYFLTRVENCFQNPKKHCSLITCIYFVLRALCCQGSDQVAKLWALRTFLITAYLTAVVICTSYSASLISVLTVKTPDEPFKELSDIVSTDYKIAIQSDSTCYDYFAKTTDALYHKIFETSVIKTNSFQNYNEAMENACRERKTVFFGILSVAFNNFKKISCVLLPLKSEISTAYEAIAVAKNSQYRQILNHRLIENGLVNRYKRMYTDQATDEPLEKEIGIGLQDVGAIFIYFGIFMTLSVGIFCLELLWWKYHLINGKKLYGAQNKPKFF